MTKCKGLTRTGTQCRANATDNGYCRWHHPTETTNEPPDDCIVCCEPFDIDDSALPCGHWVHVDCVQKSADALQEVRSQEGYPPIEECTCPVCRAAVPGLKPKEAQPIQPPQLEVILTHAEMYTAYRDWEVSSREAPLSFYIWVRLSGKYPNHPNPDALLTAAEAFAVMINLGVVILQPPSRPDQRFTRVLAREWR